MGENSLVHRFRVGQITIEVRQGRNTKVLLFRNDRSDLPHLLFSFGNPSKEIDVHLKSRAAGAKEVLRSIAKISDTAVTIVLENVEPRLKEIALQHVVNIRPVRPGWLGKKGYVVSYLNEESERKLVEIFAPKRKYHSKWERVLRASGLDDFVQSDLPGEMLFLPSVLHELKKLQYSRPVMVHRIRGRHRPAMTALRLGLTSKGRLEWFPVHKFVNDLRYVGELVVDELRQLVPGEKWELVWDALHLEEVDWIANRVKENG